MARGLDHVVVAVGDLTAAAAVWTELGFTVTPENKHPWGTVNRLIQFDGFFIELLSLAEVGLIPAGRAKEFSFGDFNRRFLEQREGISMLVAESKDPDEDRRAFEALNLMPYAPFSFERQANFQDGTTGMVGFDLTFLTSRLLPGLAFFTCRNRYPQTFWSPEFQQHKNGAVCLRTVFLVDEDPSDHHEFLGGFVGQREMRATSLGLELHTPRGTILVLNPDAYKHIAGKEAYAALSGTLPQIAAIEIGCKGLAETKTVPADRLHGMSLILTPEN